MPHRRRFHVEGATNWRQLGLRADRRASSSAVPESLPPSHTVQVQYSVANSATAFDVDDWALVVQRIKV
jgi:hypothetical protein